MCHMQLSYNNIDERVTDNVVVWDTELQVAPNGKLCNGESCRWQVQVLQQ